MQVAGYGEPLRLVDAPTPEPGPGEVRIAVHRAGVNFPDMLLIEGSYQVRPEPPFAPGFEVAGEVSAIGPGVEGVAVGDRVLAYVPYGGYAEEVVAAARTVFPIPDVVSFTDAAVVPIAYGTSHHALTDRAALQPGEVLVVLGAAGGVGLTAVELGKLMGATVIGIVGGGWKGAVVSEQGADHVIDHTKEDVRGRVLELTDGRGADVIYDAIAPVHVSGHASQEEQRLLLQTVKPKFFVPIHGELRHLRQHARLALESGIDPSNIAVVENGTVIEFHKGRMSIGERVPGGYVFVDGRGVGDVGPEVMRERETLARDGFVLVHVQLDAKTGRLRGEPQITTRGFVVLRNGVSLLDTARARILDLVNSANGIDLQARLERELGKLFFGETRRNPMVLVVLSGS